MDQVSRALLEKALILLDLAGTGQSKKFGAALQDFNNSYRRASSAQQGAYHHAWAARMGSS